MLTLIFISYFITEKMHLIFDQLNIFYVDQNCYLIKIITRFFISILCYLKFYSQKFVKLPICFIINLVLMIKGNMFRSVPSAIPIKSPSPDSKRANNITPTKSPEEDIKREIINNKKAQRIFDNHNYTSNQCYGNHNNCYYKSNGLNNTGAPLQGKNHSSFQRVAYNSNEFNPVSPSRVQHEIRNSPQAFNISFSYQGEMNNVGLYRSGQIDQSVLYCKSPNNYIPQTAYSNQLNQKSHEFRQQSEKAKYRNQNYDKYPLKESHKNNLSFEQNANGSSQQVVSSFKDFAQTLREKDQIISELRNILSMISDSQNPFRQSDKRIQLPKISQQRAKQMKQQIQVLTIENQKLLAIIDRLSARQNDPTAFQSKRAKQNKSLQIEQLRRQVTQLQQSIILNRQSHEKQMESLLKSHKSLANHCNDIEKNKKSVEQQNKRLLRLLQQKDISERKLFQQRRVSQLQAKSDSLADRDKQKGQKLTIAKIKEQYNQNMRLFKQIVYDQVDEMYNTIQQTIQQTNGRLIDSQNRVKQLQQKIEYFGVSAFRGQPNIQKNKKSQIYIEEAPSSSSDRQGHNKSTRSDNQQDQETKQEQLGAKLHSIAEESRVRQVESLKEQLERVTQELGQIRFKYEKMSLDSQITPYSKRSEDDDYNLRLLSEKEFKLKDMQITALKQELLTLNQSLKNTGSQAQNRAQTIIQYEYKISLLQQKIGQYQQQRVFLKKNLQNRDQQMVNLQQETEQKVKLLIQSFEKQIGILRQQVINKNNHQNQLKQQISTLCKQIAAIQEQRNQFEQKIVMLEQILSKEQQNLLMVSNQLKQCRQQLIKKQYEMTAIGEQLNLVNKRAQKADKAEIKAIQLQNELQTANKKLNNIRSDQMVQQLKEVKRLINPEQVQKLEIQFTQLSDMYNKVLGQYEQRVKQSELINEKNISLTEKVLKNQENNIALQERISLLETTISVYQSQLKNRKELYENLIQRRSTIQLEGQKLKRQRDQVNKEKFNEMRESSRIVNEKIDFILRMQTEREREIQELIRSIGLTSYRSSKAIHPISTEKSEIEAIVQR